MEGDEPIFRFGKGRNQIIVRGERAVRECGWAIRTLLVSRAVATVVAAVTAAALVLFHFLGYSPS